MSRTEAEEKNAQDNHNRGHDHDGATRGSKNPHKSTCNENDASHYAFQGYSALCPHRSGLLLGNSTEGGQEAKQAGRCADGNNGNVKTGAAVDIVLLGLLIQCLFVAVPAKYLAIEKRIAT